MAERLSRALQLAVASKRVSPVMYGQAGGAIERAPLMLDDTSSINDAPVRSARVVRVQKNVEATPTETDFELGMVVPARGSTITDRG